MKKNKRSTLFLSAMNGFSFYINIYYATVAILIATWNFHPIVSLRRALLTDSADFDQTKISFTQLNVYIYIIISIKYEYQNMYICRGYDSDDDSLCDHGAGGLLLLLQPHRQHAPQTLPTLAPGKVTRTPPTNQLIPWQAGASAKFYLNHFLKRNRTIFYIINPSAPTCQI